jgi:16S rRNA (cytidine1402-2'-O)-methyltransferase
MPTKGTLYLIPTVLSPDALETIPTYITNTINQLQYFFVEQERTARRFLKALNRAIVIDDLELFPMNEHQAPDLKKAAALLEAGKDVGVMSEAGCPAIADPGHLVVQVAHQLGAKVVPLVGPNSILLALMASGMNGQNFQFVGYVPVKNPDRQQRIKELELTSQKFQQTQIFIEAPYRNNALIADILHHCQEQTRLCIAADLTAPSAYVRTLRIGEWKKNGSPDIHKRPAIFLLYADH